MLKFGDLVYYKNSLYVISKVYRGKQFVDLNNVAKRVPVNGIKVLNILQNLLQLPFLRYVNWNEDVKNIFLKRLAEKLPLHILKGVFLQLKNLGITETQHYYFFNQFYKKISQSCGVPCVYHKDEALL